MSRARRPSFRCAACGTDHPKWVGRCPGCQAWNSLSELSGPPARPIRDGPGAGPPRPIADVPSAEGAALATGLSEVDRVLGGGLVPGSVTLVGGEPGIGKSTLLLQAVASLVGRGVRVLYLAAEESAAQVRARAERLGAVVPGLWLVADPCVDNLVGHLAVANPDVVVVDSIQAVHTADRTSPPGSVTQVRECAHRLVDDVKARGIASVLVGHVTKDGSLAGPRQLEHLVDSVLTFEGDRYHSLRQLRAVKHRFGATHELGLFEMTELGLVGVPDASGLFLGDRLEGVAGSSVHPVVEGHRSLLVELQALVVASPGPAPRRSAEGVDGGRLALLLGVLHQRVGVPVLAADVYASAVGGVRVDEPAADLALALALLSGATGHPLDPQLVACGEVGLAGEVRSAPHLARRLAESARLGFRRAVVPLSAPDPVPGIEVVRVRSVAEAAAACGLLPGPGAALVGSRRGARAA